MHARGVDASLDCYRGGDGRVNELLQFYYEIATKATGTNYDVGHVKMVK